MIQAHLARRHRNSSPVPPAILRPGIGKEKTKLAKINIEIALLDIIDIFVSLNFVYKMWRCGPSAIKASYDAKFFRFL